MKLFSLINLITFQACWYISAIYQQKGLPVILLILGTHFCLSKTKKADIEVLLLALIGVVVDQLLIIFNIIQIPESASLTPPLIIPFWLIAIWCGFAWSFNHSLHWLTKLSIFKVAILGAVFGSLSYFAALQMNVFSSVLPNTYFILLMALVWLILLPFLTHIFVFIIEKNENKTLSKHH